MEGEKSCNLSFLMVLVIKLLVTFLPNIEKTNFSLSISTCSRYGASLKLAHYTPIAKDTIEDNFEDKTCICSFDIMEKMHHEELLFFCISDMYLLIPSKFLHVRSQQWRISEKVWIMFKVDCKGDCNEIGTHFEFELSLAKCLSLRL